MSGPGADIRRILAVVSVAGLLASCSSSGSFGVTTSLEPMPSGQAEPVIRGTVTIIGGDFMHVGLGECPPDAPG
jgi:hypothetical protein